MLRIELRTTSMKQANASRQNGCQNITPNVEKTNKQLKRALYVCRSNVYIGFYTLFFCVRRLIHTCIFVSSYRGFLVGFDFLCIALFSDFVVYMYITGDQDRRVVYIQIPKLLGQDCQRQKNKTNTKLGIQGQCKVSTKISS